jgi:hypothetical protein
MEKFFYNKNENVQGVGSNKIEKPQMKKGVDFVFEQCPQLGEIGTKEQYSEYLDTVFPESLIKEIVFHGTDSEFKDHFNDEYLGKKDPGYYGKGFYFWTGKYALEGARSIVFSYTNKQPGYSNIKAAVVNIQKPRQIQEFDFSNTGKDFTEHDGSILKGQLVVKSSNQIHLLGSNQDIEKFKEFVARNEDEKERQSIEDFLREQGLERVPHIKISFFFNKHATAEDGQMVADRLKDKDIFIQENAGWDEERLLTLQKVTNGEFTADQAIEHEKARGKAFFWTDYYKAIFENIYGTNKEILLVDIKDDSELYKKIYDLMKMDGVYWNILDRSKTYDEVIEHIGDTSQLESLSQEERENEILKNTKQNLLELLKNKPELQNKQELDILFSMGSFHTRLYHEMKKGGDDVAREYQSMPYTFSPRMEVERLVHFKGREVAESSMPKVLLYLLLGKTGVFPLGQMKHEQQHMVMKKFNTDVQIRELYERYQKSKSDEQFRKDINSWIAEQYKK